MKKNIIFIAGVHGVGKTTLCKSITYELGIKRYSSSELISSINAEKVKKDKHVDDIEGNQNILIEAVSLYINEDEVSLLDGHFCLINGDDNIKELPIDTFDILPIQGIIILVDEPKRILDRMKQRDDKNFTIDFISEFQDKEVKQGISISNRIGVWREVINVSDNNRELIKLIKLKIKNKI